jgi:hypothetical protein
MAKIYYDVMDLGQDEVKPVSYNGRSEALKAARKPRHIMERMVVTEPADYLEPEKHAGQLFTEKELITFINNEQNTYRFCPWGGKAKVVAFDEKYELYHTTNLLHSGKEGFYLVDNNSRLK